MELAVKMNFWLSFTNVIAFALLCGPVRAQDGHMMNGDGQMDGWMGGHTGAWISILLLIILGLLAWIVMRKRK